MSKEGNWKSYKQIETHLRKNTNKEFFITNTKGNNITIVITRDNKLLTYTQKSSYMSWLTDNSIQQMLNFINQE